MLYKSLVLLYKSAAFTLWLTYVVVSSTACIMAWIFSTLFRYSFYTSTAAGISKDTGKPCTAEALCWTSLALNRFIFQQISPLYKFTKSIIAFRIFRNNTQRLIIIVFTQDSDNLSICRLQQCNSKKITIQGLFVQLELTG